MQPLERQIRNTLERTIKDARGVSDAGAAAAVDQLGVGEPKPFSHLSNEEKELRRQLRIHGRQLGDQRDARSKTQGTACLVEEIAYEHWHRMLFARFLAENNLLMYPDPDEPVPVSLDECEDLATDEGAANGWELAARFATRMLPQIFRPDSPVFQLTLPPEHQQKLERLLADLPAGVFKASDALGWVYQFWQAKRKDEINASEVKIGARELPAVTQLFTEPYMVAFLLDNSLGAWWAGRRLSESDLKNASSEAELRTKASLPGVPLEYLRFIQEADGTWAPAAGTFEGWPAELSDLKVLDPCCGSGHFLVAAFLMLVPMRMEMDGLSEQNAVDAVLRENLHGLEIDQRCVELAAFALALAAWMRTGHRPLPELQVACTGIAPQATQEQWLELAEKVLSADPTLAREPIKNGLANLHRLFSQAPTLGSLIDPTRLPKDLITADFETLEPVLERVLTLESASDEMHERAIAAHGMTKAAELLVGPTGGYSLVITNVPYLGREKQAKILRDLAERKYDTAKADLATIFILRCLELASIRGTISVVVPQYWLFLSRYEHLRRQLVDDATVHSVARLGPGAFETISGEVVNVALTTLSPERAAVGSHFGFIDVTDASGARAKADALVESAVKTLDQRSQADNPNAVIGLEHDPSVRLLEAYSYCYQGLATSDNARFLQNFWERSAISRGWVRYQFAPQNSGLFGGLSHILYWDGGTGDYYDHCMSLKQEGRLGGWKSGHEAWGKHGIAVNRMGSLASVFYLGTHFDCNVAVIIPDEVETATPVHAYCVEPSFNLEVRKLNQKLSVTNATLAKVPFDLERWQGVAAEKYPNGLPQPYSDDPTQWIFHGHPAPSDEPLQVAVARLLGYRWPAESDDELELSDEARAWVDKCEDLLPLADDDGIVCIPPVRGEAAADDRLHNLLAKAYGDEWSTSTLNELLKQAGHGGKTLESWLRDKFFSQHCQLFGQRPFIWHIWDGLRDGFSALVNYHKLDRKNLETLIYTYVGDWITRQRDDLRKNIDGAQERLDAAEALKKRLELILAGESPYDIFVRWKSIEKQPIGWDPDLNDGVCLNIRPFMSVLDVSKTGAGVLRDKPKVKWTKDRGKGAASAPWHGLGLQYGGNETDRVNDHHLTLEEKNAARQSVVEVV